jgi:hypothetical protein
VALDKVFVPEAWPRRLMAQPSDGVGGQLVAHRGDHALAIRVGRRFGVDVQRLQPRHNGHVARLAAEVGPEQAKHDGGRGAQRYTELLTPAAFA